jgi:hypothetical protein
LLAGAAAAVNGQRNEQYAEPIVDFSRTAGMWNAYLGVETISAYDVAALMILVKMSRIRNTPEAEDSWMDVAGYAACGWDVAAP